MKTHLQIADDLLLGIENAAAKDQVGHAIANYDSFLRTWQVRIGLDKYLSEQAKTEAPTATESTIIS